MKLRPSLPFEGKCDICGEEKMVYTIGDEDTKKIVTLCKDCASKYSDEEIFEKFGHEDKEIFKSATEKPSDVKFTVQKNPKAS